MYIISDIIFSKQSIDIRGQMALEGHKTSCILQANEHNFDIDCGTAGRSVNVLDEKLISYSLGKPRQLPGNLDLL